MAEAFQLNLQALGHTPLVLDEEDPQSLHGSPSFPRLTWRRFLVCAEDDRAISTHRQVAGRVVPRQPPLEPSRAPLPPDLQELPAPALSGSRTPETLHSRIDGLNKANPSMPTRKTSIQDRSRRLARSTLHRKVEPPRHQVGCRRVGTAPLDCGVPGFPPSGAIRCSSSRILNIIIRCSSSFDVGGLLVRT